MEAKRQFGLQTLQQLCRLERNRRDVPNWRRHRDWHNAISDKCSARKHRNNRQIKELADFSFSGVLGYQRSKPRTKQRPKVLQRSFVILRRSDVKYLTSKLQLLQCICTYNGYQFCKKLVPRWLSKTEDQTKQKPHLTSSESQKNKMQVFGLAFILYYLKLSDGSGFWIKI